jgi:hypothetical protein
MSLGWSGRRAEGVGQMAVSEIVMLRMGSVQEGGKLILTINSPALILEQ